MVLDKQSLARKAVKMLGRKEGEESPK